MNYFGDKTEGDDGDSEIVDSVVNVLKPFLFEGAIGILQKVHQSSIHKDETAGFLFTKIKIHKYS